MYLTISHNALWNLTFHHAGLKAILTLWRRHTIRLQFIHRVKNNPCTLYGVSLPSKCWCNFVLIQIQRVDYWNFLSSCSINIIPISDQSGQNDQTITLDLSNQIIILRYSRRYYVRGTKTLTWRFGYARIVRPFPQHSCIWSRDLALHHNLIDWYSSILSAIISDSFTPISVHRVFRYKKYPNK